MKHVPLSSIEFDSATQARVEMEPDVVNDYAERMAAGDKFPPVDLFAEGKRYFIGDGWYRLIAAQQIGTVTFPAEVHEGGRLGAIKHALGANQKHGVRRTNADKRRAVEIALREFADLSDRQIAEMCGVDHKTVAANRGISPVETEARMGADGKIRHLPRNEPEPREPAPEAPPVGGPIEELRRIDPLDDEKEIRDDGQSNNLYNLNLYWNRSSKADRREFVTQNRSTIKEHYENKR